MIDIVPCGAHCVTPSQNVGPCRASWTLQSHPAQEQLLAYILDIERPGTELIVKTQRGCCLTRADIQTLGLNNEMGSTIGNACFELIQQIAQSKQPFSVSQPWAMERDDWFGHRVGTQPDAPAVQPQASQEEDPGLGTSAHGAAEGAARRNQSRRRGSSASSMRPQDHPFLQLQQTGFDMLERELAGMRRDTNTRLDRVAMLLRPLGRIASSLDRIATAMERAWPPNDPPPPPVVPLPPPVVPLPPPIPSPSTRSTRSTSSIATPGPSFVESRRGRRKRPYRGGRK
ncbi:unnamed protein product [Boreogadus saida]